VKDICEQSAKNDSLLQGLISSKQEFGNAPFQLHKRNEKRKRKRK
jgi:hypothetical protein